VLLGFGIGVALSLGAMWFGLRRYIRRVRAAEQRARAAERMAEIGAMTGGLAHEIKNPLSTIGMNAQLLIESIEELDIPDADRNRLLSRMKGLGREVERLRGILTDFLEFAGKVHLEPHECDINTLVDQLIDFYTPEAERHGVKIRSEYWREPLMARIDDKLVKQALLNLMLNATQAMASTAAASQVSSLERPPTSGSMPAARIGELILKTSRQKDEDGEPVAHIDVIDTGPGIPEETLAKIFQPYFTTKSGGTGLGLPAARRLIEEHLGRLEVHSEPGRGTNFTVVLPLLAEDR